jgi:hypothetical protein
MANVREPGPRQLLALLDFLFKRPFRKKESRLETRCKQGSATPGSTGRRAASSLPPCWAGLSHKGDQR